MRARSILVALSLLAPALAAGCATTTTEREGLSPLEAVEEVDLSRYAGTWYEIANYPTSFQEGCSATTATYEATQDGRISVTNRCRKDGLDGELAEARGWARVVDSETNAKLEVSFFRPFWGDYWVIELDEDYSYAVVGHPGRDYLWILSREPQMDADLYAGILDRLDAKEYDTSRLVKTLQPT